MKYSILLVLIFTGAAFGQLIPPIVTGNETPKEKRRIEKQLKAIEKQERKKQEAIQKRVENDKILPAADLDKVGLFPQNYVDQTLRFKFVLITGMQNLSENGKTIYFAKVEKGEKTYYPSLSGGELSFLVMPSLAEQFYEASKKYADGFGNNIPAHITVILKRFNLPNGKTTYVAGVKCIELVSVMGIKMEKLGECQ